MLRVIGILLILGAAVLYGYQGKQRLFEHVKQLVGLKEMLLMLSGEISYARTPLGEAFYHIADQGKEPYGAMLFEVSRRMEEAQGETLKQIWREVLTEQREAFLLNQEEFMVLWGLGENFGYLDKEMQLANIELYIQQTEVKLVQAQQELLAKQKMYQYLSVMCGLFLILILL